MGYTIRVQRIVEMFNDKTETQGFLSIEEMIRNACPKIFNFDYEIFNQDYKLTLESNIIRHYYMREISTETVALWQLYLSSWFHENMPKYNLLYKAIDENFNPIGNYNLNRKNTTEHLGTIDHITKGENANENINKFSQTPQNGLQDIKADRYLTTATINEDKQKLDTTNTDKYNNSDKTSENISGLSGITAGEAVEKFRQFHTVDKLIIDELSPLFFGLWK